MKMLVSILFFASLLVNAQPRDLNFKLQENLTLESILLKSEIRYQDTSSVKENSNSQTIYRGKLNFKVTNHTQYNLITQLEYSNLELKIGMKLLDSEEPFKARQNYVHKVNQLSSIRIYHPIETMDFQTKKE